MAGRPRSPQQEKFFDELKEWSEIKLRILTKYFDAYRRKRGASNSILYYIDGFAGAGWYGDDPTTHEEGSPVRLARMADEIVRSGQPYRLVCLNYEINLTWFTQLRQALSSFDSSVVRCTHGAFEDHLPGILTTVGQAPALFFLDPFGVSPIRLVDLQPILRRRDTEILLNLNTPRLRQMAGFHDSRPSGERDAKLRLVSEVLGESTKDPNPRWLQQYRRMDTASWEDWAANAYMESLLEQGSELRYAVAYPIRERFRAKAKYYLVFATRSDDAVVLMNDFVCIEEDDLFAKSEGVTKTGQLTLDGPLRESDREQALEDLLDEIHAYGVTHQGCSRTGLTKHFAGEKFGQFKQKHYRQAINRLVEDGRAAFPNGRRNDTAPITFLSVRA